MIIREENNNKFTTFVMKSRGDTRNIKYSYYERHAKNTVLELVWISLLFVLVNYTLDFLCIDVSLVCINL